MRRAALLAGVLGMAALAAGVVLITRGGGEVTAEPDYGCSSCDARKQGLAEKREKLRDASGE
ncbi:hypothetical protein K1T73_16100 [Roseovarius sp. SCSIO 43702]|uniref:hypothetical protein n=1 Tax=Roseovarius sp. SCSIO 43702 TaxID=2823043 RepID=UPI001C73B9B2|nr:hypothetical protein [Roseovarius sp. SCSIO 43702]QYX56545.1 hypothetical protein K1T73_16100 [Roseovarius sp. SCSIO 43702]